MQRLYDETRNSVRYDIHGAHRGGRDHLQLLSDKVQESPVARMPEVGLHDLRAGRSQDLAWLWETSRVSVTMHNEEAPPESKAPTIDVFAIDDAKRVARVVDQPVRSPVLEVGIVVAAATVERLGGPVIGLGMTATPDSKEVSQQARRVFNTIADMAGERHSSRNMSELIVNNVQMNITRVQTHSRLTDSSLDYLERGKVSPEIFAVDGFTKDVSPLAVMEARRDTRRQDLRDLATQEILPQVMSAEDRAGVAFYDSQDPWLYLVFARRRGSYWRTANMVEFPVQILGQTVIPVGDLVEERPKSSPATWSRTWVTD